MRADALRNRQTILDAAIELILEVGGEPARDAVAARAGVGIGTLYRHFPDQQQLLRASAMEVLDRALRAGHAALDESATGGEALRRYLHAAIDLGLATVNIISPLLGDTEWPEQRDAARALLDRLVARAVADGALPPDHTATDVALAAIRFCRPLAIGLEPAAERAIAHRQLTSYLDGLARSASGRAPSPAPVGPDARSLRRAGTKPVLR